MHGSSAGQDQWLFWVMFTFTVGFLPDFHSISVPSALCRMGSPSSSKMWYVFVCAAAKVVTSSPSCGG